MIVNQWKISTDWTLPARWFWVRVYDTPETLRKIATRVSPHTDYSGCFGCVQEVTPWIPEGVSEEDQDDLPLSDLYFPENGFAGVVRLIDDYLYPEIIWHEVFHAACSVFRMNVAQRPQLEGFLDPERDNEEALAYAVGQLGADMNDALLKWSNTEGHQEM